MDTSSGAATGRRLQQFGRLRPLDNDGNLQLPAEWSFVHKVPIAIEASLRSRTEGARLHGCHYPHPVESTNLQSLRPGDRSTWKSRSLKNTSRR